MDINVEQFLQENIFPELEMGRPNWDRPHTESVIFYIKEIIRHTKKLSLDSDVLIIAAYAHDWGYANLFQKGQYVGNIDIDEVKKLHARISVEKITKLLESPNFNHLQEKQKARICHLVFIHDDIETLKKTDELVLMEADTLGQLDISRISPTLNEKDNAKFMDKTTNNRISRFITLYGKKKAEELYALREKYYQNFKSGI